MEGKTIKLIALNAWGGKLFDQLMDFFRERRDETDIFCLEEIPFGEKPVFTEQGLRENLFAEIKSTLAGFDSFARPSPAGGKFAGKELKIPFGIAIFARKELGAEEAAGFLTYPEDGWFAKSEKRTPTGNFLCVKLTRETGDLFIGDIHGLFLAGAGKGDVEERLWQSRKVLEFFRGQKGGKVLCGDFNLEPDTESVAMIGREMRNLIREYRIESTRSELYNDMEKWADFIADYVFVSPDTKVRDFKVLGDVVSDHLPLFLEFS